MGRGLCTCAERGRGLPETTRRAAEPWSTFSTPSPGDGAEGKGRELLREGLTRSRPQVAALPGPRGLLGGVAQALHKAFRGTVAVVTWAPATVLGTAGRVLGLSPARTAAPPKGRAMSLSDALKGVTDNVVDTVVHYVPVSPASHP